MAQTSTSSLVEQEAKKLIQKLTSFKDSNDENFRRSLQFALSNFKFHRYLDVDSHKITRKLQGLFQKFEIHSQLEKAVSLRKLTDKFLQLPLSPKSRDAKTDLHYSVLSVLLNLSDSPVNATYTETQHVPKQREEDKFDWGAFLQEGLAPILSFQDSSSDEWSEEEVLDDSAIQADQSETSPAALQHPIGHAVSGHPIRSQGFGEGHRGRSWLARNVIVQYWEGDRDSALQGLHSAASLASTWRAYEQQRDPFAPADERYTLTETHIIRETIWVLMGAETSFVYQLHDSKFTSRQDIQVSHLTPKALHKFTSKLAETCTNAWTLQSFVDSIRAAPMSYIKAKDDPTRGQTFESFAEALSVMLWEFRKELTAWERDIAKQEASLTLSKFAADLEPWAKRLALLELVYQAGTARNEPASCAQSTWLLLTALQGTIEAEYEQGTHREENVLILLRVWLGTIRPYIHFLDNWLSGYPLCDPAQEFVIQRNPEITVKSPDFWEKAFTLHHFTPPSKHGTTQLPQSGAQPSGPDQRQKEGRVSAGHLERVAVPSFLQPVLRQILLAGKCMELLESMGQLSLVWRKYHPEKSSVYDDFSESVKKLLCPRSSDLAGEKTDTSHPQPSRNTSSAIVSLTELQNLGIRDPLMAHNFRDLFTELEYFSTEPCADNESWSSLPDFSSALTSHMKPLTLILHRCLYPLLMAKCQTICKELVVALKKDYHLTETFASMRRYYLCEAGDTMFDFLSDLFDKLRLCQHKSQWQDTLYLNYQLQTAVAAGYPSDADRLTVSFEPVNVPSTVSIQPIHALDGLTLHYKVPWPLDIIINAKTITAYNQVFRFLLQVKRAKYCLEQLRFSSIIRSSFPAATTTDPKDKPEVRGDSTPSARPQPLHKAQLLHRVFLLRFKLIHFVNAVHSYLMSRILHSTGLEFQADIERAPDLEAIVELHTTYLAKVSERCLLHKKVGLVREAVLKALNLALVFQRRWDAGLSAFNAERIDQMLSEFNKCSVFLLTMLDNINKRGAFPHLEALALSLTQSHEESSSTGSEEAQQTS